jgi:hypothetical protein
MWQETSVCAPPNASRLWPVVRLHFWNPPTHDFLKNPSSSQYTGGPPAKYLHGALAIALGTPQALHGRLAIEALKEHRVLMLPTKHLYGTPSDSQARRPCRHPVVMVLCDREVTVPRRIVLRAAVHQALTIVNFPCVQSPSYGRLVRRHGTDDHSFVVRWTKWPEVVASLIGHNPETLYFHLEQSI